MCGIIGIVGPDALVESLVEGMDEIGRRGEEGTGLHFSIGEDRCHTTKRKGTPKKAFPKSAIQNLEAKIEPGTIKVGIGHIRYRTSGARKASNQPIYLKKAGIAVIHNGNIFGSSKMLKELKKRRASLLRKDYSDTELFTKLIASSKKATLEERLVETLDFVSPTTNIILQHKDTLYVYKDPTNCNPLSIGRIGKKGFTVASEPPALNKIAAYNTQDVKPGQLLRLEKGKASYVELYKPWEHMCIFNSIYLATAQKPCEASNPLLWGKDFTESRKRAGRMLFPRLQQSFKDTNF
jgi:amidophosphoribosyltransferase